MGLNEQYVMTWLTKEHIDAIDEEGWAYLNRIGIKKEDFIEIKKDDN